MILHRPSLSLLCCFLVVLAALFSARGTDAKASTIILLEADGVAVGFFEAVSNLGSESEIIEYRTVDPDGKEVTQKLPGRTHWQNITLVRRLTDSGELWQWRRQVLEDAASARRNGTLIFYDSIGNEVGRWSFENGWPSSISIEATSGGAIEKIEIAVEKVERA